MNGHFEIINKRQPVNEVLAASTPEKPLYKKLINIQQARQFAVTELKLPDNGSYTTYVDIGRPYATWNVIAAPALSLQAKQWCFFFTGCIRYRGYFSEQQANEYAKELEQQGYDVYVAGARAYSTLGWFDDPLLNTMMYNSEASRVGVLFHELTHQKIYIEDDSEFNESLATMVEQLGTEQWLLKNGKWQQYQDYIQQRKINYEFYKLLEKTQKELKSLYDSNLKDQEKFAAKQQIIEQLKENYREIKSSSLWNNYSSYDHWMAQPLNNAHFVGVATYHNLVEKFKCQYKSHNNWTDFYEYIQKISLLGFDERRIELNKCQLDYFFSSFNVLFSISASLESGCWCKISFN